MNSELRDELMRLAMVLLPEEDQSHDLGHALRVLGLAELLSQEERRGDLEILVPSALFHDIVTYPKRAPDLGDGPLESAEVTARILSEMRAFPKEKIPEVSYCIASCSVSKGVAPVSFEARILQDADALDSIGASGIMRVFSSSGIMRRPFYNMDDPFARRRECEPLKYALDVFYDRMLPALGRMRTKTGHRLAIRRIRFLYSFLGEVESELGASRVSFLRGERAQPGGSEGLRIEGSL